MAAILNSAILNLAILDSAILVFSLKFIHTCQDWFSPFALNKLHSFILNQLDDGSHLEFCHVWCQTLSSWIQITLLSSFRFTQKHSHSTLTLIQINSIWLKLIQSHLTWWWWPSWIWPSWIQSILIFSFQTRSHLPRLVPTICTKDNFIHSSLTQLDDGSQLEFYHLEFRHCHLGFRHLVIFFQSHSHLPRLVTSLWFWHKLIQSDSNSFLLTQLDDGSQLEFCHVGFRHCHLGFRHLSYVLSRFTQKHSHSTMTGYSN